MYAGGLGIAKNQDEAISLYQAAANAREFLAQIELGRIFSQGIDVPIDREAALRWYSVAASQESIVAERKELQEAKAYLRSAA
jgi:TPR repeat protein